MKRSLLISAVALLGLSGCHLISNPDQVALELHDTPTKGSRSAEMRACAIAALPTPPNQVIAPAWWEGDWELDPTSLSRQLALELEHDPDFIGASLAEAFSLQVRAQQAMLTVDGRSVRLATTPLQQRRGARLVGAQREVFIWCEGDQAYWRVESGERFSLRRAQPKQVSRSPSSLSPSSSLP